jgi:hypothetical protein
MKNEDLHENRLQVLSEKWEERLSAMLARGLVITDSEPWRCMEENTYTKLFDFFHKDTPSEYEMGEGVIQFQDRELKIKTVEWDFEVDIY